MVHLEDRTAVMQAWDEAQQHGKLDVEYRVWRASDGAWLQHRTPNLLAVVRNVARRSIGPSPERDEYDARLAALGRVQGFLSRSRGYSVPLVDVVEAELHAAGDGASNKVGIAGLAVDLPGESVQAVALALHELAVNAVKYGAIARPPAQLSVLWRIEAGQTARQAW